MGILRGYQLIKKKIKSFFFRNSAIILGYHGVTNGLLPFSNWIQIEKKLFEEHIRYLSSNFTCIKLSDLLSFINQGNISHKMVCITFDDGYANNFKIAFPILKRYQVPATIFVSTGYLNTTNLLWHDLISVLLAQSRISMTKFDGIKLKLQTREEKASSYRRLINKYKQLKKEQRNSITCQLAQTLKIDIENIRAEGDLSEYRLLNWAEIKEMEESGLIEFGSHTINHSILSLLSEEDAMKEIIGSKKILERHLSNPIDLFSYPNGTERDFNQRHVEILKTQGFECAVTTIRGRVTGDVDPFRLPRYCVGDQWTVDQLDYLLF